MVASYRRGRINEELTKEIAEILRTVKDPRIQKWFVSITAVDCTADLRSAKVYYSAVGREVDMNEVKKGLLSASGYIRSQIAQRMNLRITPELRFYADNSLERGTQMSALLRSVDIPAREPEDDDE